MKLCSKRASGRITAIALAFAIAVGLLIPVYAADCTVTFHANGGTVKTTTGTPYPTYPVSKVMPAGETLSKTAYAPPAAGTHLTREGYVLPQTIEWYTGPNAGATQWTLTTPVSGDMNLYVHWRQLIPVSFNYTQALPENIINPSKVTFNRYSVTYTDQVADGERLTSSQITGTTNAPRTRSLLFDQWCTDSELNNPLNFNDPVRGVALNLYAKWLPANNVIFDLNYANYPLNQEKNEQKLGGKMDDPNPDILNVIQVLDDTVIPSHLRPATISAPNRTAAGWNFVGWFLDPDNKLRPFDITKDKVPKEIGNLELYAHWEKPVNVTFNYNWGDNPPVKDIAVANKPNSGKPIPASVLTGDFINPTTAQRKPNENTCPHWNDLCAASADCTATKIIPSNSSRHGNEWSLEGWYTQPVGGTKWVFGAEGVGTPVPDTDLTLYAHWIKSHKVTYDLGAVTPADLSAPANYSPFRYYAPKANSIETTGTYVNVNITLLVSKKNIHTGWYKKQDYKDLWVASGAAADVLTEDTTLYAGWLKADLTSDNGLQPAHEITFDENRDPKSPSPSSQISKYLVPPGGKGNQLYQNNTKRNLPAPTFTGYDFNGWFEHKEDANGTPCTHKWNDENVVTSDLTVFGKWSRKITVEFIVPGEYSIVVNSPVKFEADLTELWWKHTTNSLIVNPGESVKNPVTASNENGIVYRYTITGWHRCEKIDCVDTNCLWTDFDKPVEVNYTDTNGKPYMRLHANLRLATVVHYDTNWPAGTEQHPYYGKFTDSSGDHFGGLLTTPISPTHVGDKYMQYVQMAPGMVIPNEPTSYLNGTHTYVNNLNVPLPVGNKTYQFAGWYKTKSGADNLTASDLFVFGTNNGTVITKDTILYAGWRSGYTVSFNANRPAGGGTQPITVPDTISVAPGALAANPNPSNDPARNPQLTGFKFIGWYTEAAGTNEWKWTTPINGNIQLFAKWAPAYIVTFNLGDAVGIAPGNQLVVSGGFVADPELITWEKHDLVGWYKTPAGARALDSSQKWDLPTMPVTGPMTLYAGWIDVYEVTFNVNYENGGTPPQPQLIWNGEHAAKFPERSHVIRVAPPLRSGWTFVGWYTQPVVNFETMSPWIFTENTVTKDTVLYAGWAEGVNINPLIANLNDIATAAELNKGDVFNLNMVTDIKTWTVMPSSVMSIIKGKNVLLNLDFGDYILHISGIGMTAEANRDRNLTVSHTFSADPWILTEFTKSVVDAKYDDDKHRPYWQINISQDVDDVTRQITLKSGAAQSWGYGILIARVGDRFLEIDSKDILNNGDLTLSVSLGAIGAGDFIVLLNDEPSSVVYCTNCTNPIEYCTCTRCPGGCGNLEFCAITCNNHQTRACQNPCTLCCPNCGYLLEDCRCCPNYAECGQKTTCPIICKICVPSRRLCEVQRQQTDPCTHSCPAGCGNTPPCPLTCERHDVRSCQPACTLCCENCGQLKDDCTCCRNFAVCGRVVPCLEGCTVCHRLVCEPECTCGSCSLSCAGNPKVACPSCNAAGYYALGDVNNKDGINIFDALEVLKFLVNMDGDIRTGTVVNDKAMRAARTTAPTDPNKLPDIFCALEILKYLVNMDSSIDGETIFGRPVS